jgi:D-alanine-D-alanine ligase
MSRILLVTGPAGDAQGWGDILVTEQMRQAIEASGHTAEIAFVATMPEFLKELETRRFDLVWSALYHVSERAAFVGVSDDAGNWLADTLDARGIPYVGPDARTMKALIHKTTTHAILSQHGVRVPSHCQLEPADTVPEIVFPAFVKPSNESRSVGVNDDSVVHDVAALKRQVRWVCDTFRQPALVEEYMPGMECTVLLLGSGADEEYLPGLVQVDPSKYGKYPILRSDLRGVGVTKIRRMTERFDEAVALCRDAMKALNGVDHLRTDMRVAADGTLKVMEVNGIPGLKPIKSWSPQLYTLYHASPQGAMEDYRRLIARIIDGALARHALGLPCAGARIP